LGSLMREAVVSHVADAAAKLIQAMVQPPS
jgi:hypothetical protein